MVTYTSLKVVKGCLVLIMGLAFYLSRRTQWVVQRAHKYDLKSMHNSIRKNFLHILHAYLDLRGLDLVVLLHPWRGLAPCLALA
jgi:hypothetical protein